MKHHVLKEFCEMMGVELMLGFFPCTNQMSQPYFAVYHFFSVYISYVFIFSLASSTLSTKFFRPRIGDKDEMVSIPITNYQQPKEWMSKGKYGKW